MNDKKCQERLQKGGTCHKAAKYVYSAVAGSHRYLCARHAKRFLRSRYLSKIKKEQKQ